MTASEKRKTESAANEEAMIRLAHATLDHEIAYAKSLSSTGSINIEVQVYEGRVNHRPVVISKRSAK